MSPQSDPESITVPRERSGQFQKEIDFSDRIKQEIKAATKNGAMRSCSIPRKIHMELDNNRATLAQDLDYESDLNNREWTLRAFVIAMGAGKGGHRDPFGSNSVTRKSSRAGSKAVLANKIFESIQFKFAIGIAGLIRHEPLPTKKLHNLCSTALRGGNPGVLVLTILNSARHISFEFRQHPDEIAGVESMYTFIATTLSFLTDVL
ncbi:hypothetical protein Tco_0382007 [Tanacetum coccineum]